MASPILTHYLVVRGGPKEYNSIMSTEDTLKSWSERPSNAEQDRIDRTERLIKEALNKSSDIQVQNARVFAKGSVRMRTNIRQTSDIDICVEARSVFYADYPEGKSRESYGHSSSDYTFATFRHSIEKALTDEFGSSAVDISGNKAIRINADVSGSRIDADVVAAFEHRRYNSNNGNYHQGIELRPKDNTSKRIINWPEQNYRNSLDKHESTYRRYRKMVRIIKRLKDAMKDAGYDVEKGGESFLVESLLWNVPEVLYGNPTYYQDLVGIFEYLIKMLADQSSVEEWGEVNELKYLFRDSQKWTRQEALDFIASAYWYLENKI
jgi:hypothetical protein